MHGALRRRLLADLAPGAGPRAARGRATVQHGGERAAAFPHSAWARSPLHLLLRSLLHTLQGGDFAGFASGSKLRLGALLHVLPLGIRHPPGRRLPTLADGLDCPPVTAEGGSHSGQHRSQAAALQAHDRRQRWHDILPTAQPSTTVAVVHAEGEAASVRNAPLLLPELRELVRRHARPGEPHGQQLLLQRRLHEAKFHHGSGLAGVTSGRSRTCEAHRARAPRPSREPLAPEARPRLLFRRTSR
mmetsp:Transcript_13382/g.36678  ORF Transcript_13382/g.36678 Transcript_13382/m.36678 type:complete len:245 (+) Transcript_13382:131-865(+)